MLPVLSIRDWKEAQFDLEINDVLDSTILDSSQMLLLYGAFIQIYTGF